MTSASRSRATTVNVRAAAARALVPVLSCQGSLAGLDTSAVGERDRGLMRALCFGVCRQLPRLEALASELLRSPLRHRDLDIQALLLIGLYQLYEMRVPTHAAVGETAGAARSLNKAWATRVLNGCLRRADRERDTLLARVEKRPEAYWSHPQWLLDRLRRAWPQEWETIAAANNVPGPMTLRVNTRRIDRATCLERLEANGIEATPCHYASEGITLAQACDVEQLPGFAEGELSVQDEAAQLAAPLLTTDLSKGARVLDACCAPGGKTAHLLEQRSDLALTALDSEAERLSRVESTLGRLGLTATICHADATSRQWWDGTPFEAILLDAPCSGTGVIRRHPDIKRLRRDSDIATLAELQDRLLDALWPTLAPGGRLVYATCSVMPEENQQRIEAFLARTPDARTITIEADWGRPAGPGRQLLPQINGHDGFFYAVLVRSAGA
ncbi:16S rRNA (cytosine(967)-C(5))-methyltransferase RsmB [Kushneria phosphatilytica]|uniref:16S rRNA (cytosine(967)-C(5))-methyltransferase n=1 Tax=Kushneria phosphatilytica TaxID=657387 RepID=A0A5C0ZWJ5_9GAMM|nr:16S rRNA (cytosine(967)-C(5))-methyltransferase RsmB [Kushneria phosphatilytica]QEL10274.1 16S rRNA (cytosine(967)-C(5))-methyltransferase RsmB [Kushneria phosphatilytica]